MAMEKVEYSFPHENEDEKVIEVEPSSAEEIKKAEKEKPKKEEVKVEVEKPKEKEVEIEVVDDTPKADRNRKPSAPPEDLTDEELEQYSDKVRNRIKHFSKGYHDERRAKEAATRERQELENYAKSIMEENNKLKGDLNKNQEALLKQAKYNVEEDLKKAKAAYKVAHESGDSDALLQAQDALTTAKLKTDKLADIKIPTLQQANNNVQLNTNSAPKPKQADEKAVAWSKQNPWFGSDDEMTSLAMGVHTRLAKQGVDLQSDEYYDAINARMREVLPDKFESTDKPEAEVSKKQSNVVAPATRSTAPKKVRLTQTQVQIAKKLGVPLELYAQKVAEEMRKT